MTAKVQEHDSLDNKHLRHAYYLLIHCGKLHLSQAAVILGAECQNVVSGRSPFEEIEQSEGYDPDLRFRQWLTLKQAKELVELSESTELDYEFENAIAIEEVRIAKDKKDCTDIASNFIAAKKRKKAKRAKNIE